MATLASLAALVRATPNAANADTNNVLAVFREAIAQSIEGLEDAAFDDPTVDTLTATTSMTSPLFDSGAVDHILNAPTGKSILGKVNNTTVMTVAASLVTFAQKITAAATGLTGPAAADLIFNAVTGQSILRKINDSTKATMSATQEDFGALNLVTTGTIGGGAITGTSLASSGSGLITAGGGLVLPSSSDTLNYYKTGSWTPTVTGSTGTTSTYTQQVGSYVKIGRFCCVWWDLVWTASTAGGTWETISGLPFTSLNNGTVAYYGNVIFTANDGGVTANSNIFTGVGSNSTTMYFREVTVGTTGAATVPNFDTAMTTRGQMTYITNT